MWQSDKTKENVWASKAVNWGEVKSVEKTNER